MSTSPELKGCETCKERKIRCDKSLPVCGNCRKSHRACIRFRLRLSWPKGKDRRRLVIGPVPAAGGENRRSKRHFLNVTSHHVEQYLALSQHGALVFDSRNKNNRPLPRITRSPPFMENRLKNFKDGSQTLSFFYSVVSDSLPSVLGLNHGFRDLLLKMALQDDSPSSRAVLFSVLSLTALHRQQRNGDVVAFKAQSMRALAKSATQGNLTLEMIMQHMAAAILLTRIEIGLDLDASSLWALFVCGVNTLLQGLSRQMTSLIVEREDVRLLYKHVHYHQVMASFSVRHWRRIDSLDEAQSIEFKGKRIDFKCRRNPSIPELVATVPMEWQVIADILALRSGQLQDGYYNSKQYQTAVDELERRIATMYSSLSVALRKISQLPRREGMSDEVGALVQTRCIIAASWIYLLRTERRLRGPSEVIASILRDAFDDEAAGLKQLLTCNLPWPIFVIGAEVSSELHRRILLDLIRRSDQAAGGPDLPFRTARELLESAWAMEDLHAPENDGGRYLDYEQKLHTLFTASEILPALA